LILPASDVAPVTAAGAVVFDGVVAVVVVVLLAVLADVVTGSLVAGGAEVTLDKDGLVTPAAATGSPTTPV
jgi:hypothetical protein